MRRREAHGKAAVKLLKCHELSLHHLKGVMLGGRGSMINGRKVKTLWNVLVWSD